MKRKYNIFPYHFISWKRQEMFALSHIDNKYFEKRKLCIFILYLKLEAVYLNNEKIYFLF